MRVLIIEDDPIAAQVIERLLRGLNADTRVAHTMQAALHLLHEHDPDVAVVDLQLPDSTPEETLTRILAMRATRPRMQIHVVTGAVNPEIANGVGATSVLHKLDMPAHLMRRIVCGLEQHIQCETPNTKGSSELLRDAVNIILESTPT